jgi:hypothetical protein
MNTTTELVITEQARQTIVNCGDRVRHIIHTYGEAEGGRAAQSLALALAGLLRNPGTVTSDGDLGLWADWGFMGVAMVFHREPALTTMKRLYPDNTTVGEMSKSFLDGLVESGEWSLHS